MTAKRRMPQCPFCLDNRFYGYQAQPERRPSELRRTCGGRDKVDGLPTEHSVGLSEAKGHGRVNSYLYLAEARANKLAAPRSRRSTVRACPAKFTSTQAMIVAVTGINHVLMVSSRGYSIVLFWSSFKLDT